MILKKKTTIIFCPSHNIKNSNMKKYTIAQKFEIAWNKTLIWSRQMAERTTLYFF